MKERKILDKAADLLLEWGYGDWKGEEYDLIGVVHHEPEIDHIWEEVDPFSDRYPTYTIKQLFALEDCLVWNYKEYWDESKRHTLRPSSEDGYSLQDVRTDRIRYCIKAIIKNEKGNKS